VKPEHPLDKTIDLSPQEYRQIDGPKRREPFLAYGWYWGVGAIASIFVVKAIIILLSKA
jgi:hypothetical protein